MSLKVVVGLTALVMALPAAAVEVNVYALFTGKAVLQIDGTRRVLSRGETSPEGVKLVDADADAALLEIDGERRRYPLGSHIGSSFKSGIKEVRILPDGAGMYRRDGKINGRDVAFLVDTGATNLALDAATADRIGVDYRRAPRELVQTAAGVRSSYRVTLESVEVGGIRRFNVPAGVMEGDGPGIVLLGMSFLSQVDMRRDGQALVLSGGR